MCSAVVIEKPPQGHFLRPAGTRRRNPAASARRVRENRLAVRRRTSVSPVFANGAVTGAFAYAVSSARRGGIGGSGGSKTLARDADGNLIRSDEVAGPFVEGDARISSRYGVTRTINGQSNLHAGVDLVPLTVDGTVNTSAYAISGTEGALVNAGVSSSFGNYVLVKTPGGNYVFYSHLASHATNIPTQISVGTRLGIIGNTGRSTGLHLHVEIRQGGYGTGAARLSPGAIYE